MPVQPTRRAWLAVATLLRAKSNALAVQGKMQRAVHVALAASILEQEAPPETVRATPAKREVKAAVKAKRKQRPGRDAAYRAALGVEPGAPLPGTLGTAHSAGAARGGRGASTKGRGTRK